MSDKLAEYQVGDKFYEDFGAPYPDRVVEITGISPNGVYRMKFARENRIVPACVLRPYTRKKLDTLKRYEQPS